jgi:hypothetical protein
MLFSKEQLGRGRAWGNRQKPKISETEAIRRLLDLALNCAKPTFPQARGAPSHAAFRLPALLPQGRLPLAARPVRTLMASPVQPGRAAKPSAAQGRRRPRGRIPHSSRSACARRNNTRSRSCRVRAPRRRSSRAGWLSRCASP